MKTLQDHHTPICLTLFFSRGMSLGSWAEVGMFDRETAIYRRLGDAGVRVGFVTYGGTEDLEYADQIPDVRILCNRWRLPSFLYERLIPLLHAGWLRKTDVIKTNQTNGARVALRSARFWNKPLIARCGYMWSEFAAKQYGESSREAYHSLKTEKLVFGAAQKIVVTTAMMKNSIVSRLPETEERIVIIPNYVDTKKFSSTEGGRNKGKLVFIGRLEPQKNVESLLEAIEPLDVHLDIIGDGSLAGKLAARFGTLGGRVRWLANVPHGELPDYLNDAGIFILPSYYEGHPKTLIEAMACAVPVIGADSPGISEIIKHKETGYLCGTNATDIRKAILELLSNDELRASLGKNARRYAEETFSLDRIFQMELRLIKKLVE